DVVRQLRELLSSAKMKAGKPQIKLPKVERQNDESEPEDVDEGDAKGKRSRKGKGRGPEKVKKRPIQKRPEGYADIHQSLLAGVLSGIAQKGDRHEYKAAGGIAASIWPGSGLFHRQPRWVVASEIVETSKRYLRTIADIDIDWVESLAKDLLKHSYSDPHWSSKTGAAMVYRRSTLFGLPVVSGRRTQLAPIDRDGARSLMIEHGLVAGDWRCREPFYLHNQELLADMEELAKRTRSRDFIIDRFHLANFYQQRLPEEIYDLRSLSNWAKKNSSSQELASLKMSSADLLESDSSDFDVVSDFPNEIQVGQSQLPLNYHFEPGNEADGVAITVPQAALRQVSEDALGWLVPGLLEEKILHLIRSLPKSQRTNFVPAPDVAKVLASQMKDVPRDQPFSQSLCQVMREYSGEVIRVSDFQMEKLPPHLRFLVRVVDDEGVLLAESREIDALQNQYAIEETVADLAAQPADEWDDKVIRPDTFESLPDQVVIHRGGVRVAAFPALVDLDDRVEMRLVDTESERDRQTRLGLARLFSVKHNRSLRSQVSHLPHLSSIEVRLSHLVDPKSFRDQIKMLLVRIALIEDKPLIQNVDDFEVANQMAASQISMASQEVALWLPKLAEEAQALRLLFEKAPATWAEVFDELKRQSGELFPKGFLRSVAWKGLAEYPRYLKAMRLRVEKLSSGGLPKDQKLNAPLQDLWNQLETLRSESRSPDAVDSIRWMLEELRVSTFAQNLGTKQTVSVKRVQEAIHRLS
ncbi:MAG: DUF3418 domain-containing protein, partial [Planctomycetota bacterium]